MIFTKTQKYTFFSTFQISPTTSVNVERSFSFFKNMITDRRHSFTVKILKMHKVIDFNDKEEFRKYIILFRNFTKFLVRY